MDVTHMVSHPNPRNLEGDKYPNPNPNPNPDPNPKYSSAQYIQAILLMNTLYGIDNLEQLEVSHTPHKFVKDDTQEARSQCINSLKSVTETENIPPMINTILDSGADRDVLSNEYRHTYSNIKPVDNINIKGINGITPVEETGDVEHVEGLNTKDGLINKHSEYSCISLPNRMMAGWKCLMSDMGAWLYSPNNKVYEFILHKGLYTLTNKVGEVDQGVLNHIGKILNGHNPNPNPNHEDGGENRKRENKYINKLVSGIHDYRQEQLVKHGVLVMVLVFLAFIYSPTFIGMIAMVAAMHEVNMHNVIHMVKVDSKVGEMITEDISTCATVRQGKVSMYDHCARGHIPHDPEHCDACMRARLMAKKNTRNEGSNDIKGANKGYVYSMDYVGPYEQDVDGNIYGLVGVEVGHTNFGNVTLTKTREAKTSLEGFLEHRNILRTHGNSDKDIVRIHHDKDKSFEGEFSEYMTYNSIENTHTGGYNPQANSRVERRNKSIKQVFKASLLYATGGLPYYNSLYVYK